MMALRARNLLELHHPAAGVLPRSSPRLSRRTPSTSARIDATDTSGTSATTPALPLTLSRFMKANYCRASLDVSSRSGIEEDPRHVVRALQRREVAGAWQGNPLNSR